MEKILIFLLSPLSTQLGATGGEEAPLGRDSSSGGTGSVCAGPPAPRYPHTTTSLLETTPVPVEPHLEWFFAAEKGSACLDPQKDKLVQPLILQIGKLSQERR